MIGQATRWIVRRRSRREVLAKGRGGRRWISDCGRWQLEYLPEIYGVPVPRSRRWLVIEQTACGPRVISRHRSRRAAERAVAARGAAMADQTA